MCSVLVTSIDRDGGDGGSGGTIFKNKCASTVDPRYNVLQYNNTNLVITWLRSWILIFSRTDQSQISLNRPYMYMYAVVRLTKYRKLVDLVLVHSVHQ